MQKTSLPPGLTPRTIVAKPAAILAFAADHGWRGDTELARAFGVSRTTVWRVLHRGMRPPVPFIAGVLSCVHGANFGDLFLIQTDAKGGNDADSDQ